MTEKCLECGGLAEVFDEYDDKNLSETYEVQPITVTVYECCDCGHRWQHLHEEKTA